MNLSLNPSELDTLRFAVRNLKTNMRATVSNIRPREKAAWAAAEARYEMAAMLLDRLNALEAKS